MRNANERGLKFSIDPREEGSVGFCLTKGSVVTVEGGPEGSTIHCVRGECWLTQEDDRRDHRLRAGDAISLDRKGQVVLQALAASQLQVAGGPLNRGTGPLPGRHAAERIATAAGREPRAAKLPIV